jgi:hypothetical protein
MQFSKFNDLDSPDQTKKERKFILSFLVTRAVPSKLNSVGVRSRTSPT